MKLSRRPLHLLGTGVLLLCALFLATAAIGFWREKQDVYAIRAIFRERETEIRAVVAEVGDGVSLERFRELFPDSSYDKEDEEWMVWIPTSYDENPSCTNTSSETKYFRLDGAVVKPVEFKGGVSRGHGDRFGPGGVLYYFKRAWYSSAERYKQQAASAMY